jgi:regulator of sigma E protease
MSVIIGLFAVMFTFGVAILAHEFGHYILAKILGVGVETFSIGMGKKLIKRKWGETTYCISAIPIGGYVVLKGSLSKEMEDQMKEEEKSREDNPDSETDTSEDAPDKKEKDTGKSIVAMATEDILMLRNKPLWVKIAIYSAGVIFNFILAIITFTLIMMSGIEVYPPKPPIVGYVESGSMPEKLGMRKGDIFESVNGSPIKNYPDILMNIKTLIESKETTLTLSMMHIDDIISETYKASLPLSQDSTKYINKFFSNFPPPCVPYISNVTYNSPADRIGLQPGDYIVEINNEPIDDWFQMVGIIQKSAGVNLRMKIKRGEEIIETEIIPKASHEKPFYGRIGIAMGDPDKKLKRLAPGAAFIESFRASFRIMSFVAVNTYEMFARFNVKEMRDNMGGPIAIGIESYRQAKSNLRDYFYFFGAFNIMLLMLNILPLPILDGGHILVSVIETIFRRPVPAKILVRIYTVMIVFLLSMALLVTCNDFINNKWRIVELFKGIF